MTFKEKLTAKYADVVELGTKWKGKGKPGKKQRTLKEIEKEAKNIVNLIPKLEEEGVDGEDRERIKKSMSKMNELMQQLKTLADK